MHSEAVLCLQAPVASELIVVCTCRSARGLCQFCNHTEDWHGVLCRGLCLRGRLHSGPSLSATARGDSDLAGALSGLGCTGSVLLLGIWRAD